MVLAVEIQSYRDLEVWKRSRTLVSAIYQLTELFPNKESYGLTSQIQRAAVSIPSNIAEGYSRRGLRDYIQFVSMAIGSLAEVDTQLFVAEDLRYVTAQETTTIRQEITILQKQLYALRNSLKNSLTNA